MNANQRNEHLRQRERERERTTLSRSICLRAFPLRGSVFVRIIHQDIMHKEDEESFGVHGYNGILLRTAGIGIVSYACQLLRMAFQGSTRMHLEDTFTNAAAMPFLTSLLLFGHFSLCYLQIRITFLHYYVSTGFGLITPQKKQTKKRLKFHICNVFVRDKTNCLFLIAVSFVYRLLHNNLCTVPSFFVKEDACNRTFVLPLLLQPQSASW